MFFGEFSNPRSKTRRHNTTYPGITNTRTWNEALEVEVINRIRLEDNGQNLKIK